MGQHHPDASTLDARRSLDGPAVLDRVLEAEVVDQVGHPLDELRVGGRLDAHLTSAVGLDLDVDDDIESTCRQHEDADDTDGEAGDADE